MAEEEIQARKLIAKVARKGFQQATCSPNPRRAAVASASAGVRMGRAGRGDGRRPYRESSVEVLREGHDVFVFVDLWQR